MYDHIKIVHFYTSIISQLGRVDKLVSINKNKGFIITVHIEIIFIIFEQLYLFRLA